MGRSAYSVIPETNGPLRSPIRDDLTGFLRLYIDGVLEEIDGVTEKKVDDLKNIDKPWIELIDDTISLFNNDLIAESKPHMNLKRIPLILENLSESLLEYVKSYGITDDERLRKKIAHSIHGMNISKYTEFLQYLTLQRLIARVDNIKNHGMLKGYYLCNKSFKKATVRVYQKFIYIEKENSKSLHSIDALLSFRDALLKRSLALLIADSDFKYIGSYYPKSDTVKSIIKWGDEILRVHGNDGYSMIGSYESILTGVIINHYDAFDNDEFLIEMTRDILNSDHEELKNLTTDMIKKILSEDKRAKVQCFAIFKVWSFPVVNEYDAADTILEFGRCRKKVDKQAMKTLGAIARRQLYLQHKSLFNLKPKNSVYSGKECDHLYDVINGKERFDPNAENYSLLQWSNYQVRGSLDPIFDADIGSYMNDRAISPEITQLWTVYNGLDVTDAIKSKEGCSIRQGINRFIKGDMLSAKDLIEYVSINGADEAWKVIGITAKEKEFKPTARLFAMLVLHMKLWFAVTEDCLKKALFKFFPQQSMDQTSTQAAVKKSKMSSPTSSDYVKIIINIDFSKWNTTFRDENTYEVFSFIDEVFDFSDVYTYTHKFFEQCRIYISSRFCVPEVLQMDITAEQSLDPDTNCNTWFHGLLGGFEGQRQKGWTLTTLLMMVYVLEVKSGIKRYLLYGQGDNQVICLEIAKSDLDQSVMDHKNTPTSHYEREIKDLIRGIKESLNEACEELALKVKIQETWFSESFFQYSKDFYIKGAKMPLDMKQLLAISPHTSLITPTQFETYKTMVATVNSCFDVSNSPMATYLIGMYISNVLILADDYVYHKKPDYTKRMVYEESNIPIPSRLINSGDRDLLLMMSKIPSNLGGTCDLSISNIFRKGAGDHVEASIDNTIRTRCKRSLSYLNSLASQGMHDINDTDVGILIKNPLSLNLNIISVDGENLKNATVRYLENEAEGVIADALAHYISTDHSDFKKKLVPKYDFDPVLAQLMYSLSAYAPISSQLERLDGSTLNRVAGVKLREYMERINEINESKISFFVERISYSRSWTDDEINNLDSVAISSSLRSHWKLENYIPPINKFNPNFTISKRMERRNSKQEPVQITISLKNSSSENYSSERGSELYRPRITNSNEYQTTNIELPHGSIKSSLEQLADIYNFVTQKDKLMEACIKNQIKTVTDIDIDMVNDPANDSPSRLLETSSIPSSSNYQTHCKVYKGTNIKEIEDKDVNLQIIKITHMSISLSELQGYIDKINCSTEVKLYTVSFKMPKAPMINPLLVSRFIPSRLSFPNSDMYYVRKINHHYKNKFKPRATDSILLLTMSIDSALANIGYFEDTGIKKQALKQHVFLEDPELYCMISVLRLLIATENSYDIEIEDYNELIQDNKKAFTELFSWFSNDKGVAVLENAGILNSSVVMSVREKLYFLACYGLNFIQNVVSSSIGLLCRFLPLYENNRDQYNSTFIMTCRFILEQPELTWKNSTENIMLADIRRKCGTVMVNYGRKLAYIRKFSGSVDSSSSLTHIQVVTSDLDSGYHEGGDLQIEECQFKSAIGMFQSIVSLIEQFKYEVILIDTGSKVRRYSRAGIILANICRGSSLHKSMNVTVILYTDALDKGVDIYGQDTLLLNRDLSKDEIESICENNSMKVLNVTYSDPVISSDTLRYLSDRDGNVFSVFSVRIQYDTTKVDDDYFLYLPSNYTASSLMNDWSIRALILNDMRTVMGQQPFTDTLTSENLDSKLNDLKLVNIMSISNRVRNDEISVRLTHARESISMCRLYYLSRVLSVTVQEIELRGSYDLRPDNSTMGRLLQA